MYLIPAEILAAFPGRQEAQEHERFFFGQIFGIHDKYVYALSGIRNLLY